MLQRQHDAKSLSLSSDAHASLLPPFVLPESKWCEEVVDLAVVGGGLAGCSAAIAALERSASVVMLEKGIVGDGQSGACGGQFAPAFENDAQTLIERYGLSSARTLLRASECSLQSLEAVLAEEHFPPLGKGGHVLALSENDERYLRAESEALTTIGVSHAVQGEEVRALIGSNAYRAGLHMPGIRHGNPLGVLRVLALRAHRLGARIHEQTPASSLRRTPEGGWEVRTPRGVVRARSVFLAGGDSLLLRHRVWAPTVLVRTSMLMTEPLSEALASTVLPAGTCAYDARHLTMDYFRREGRRLLLGGGDSIASVGMRGERYLRQRLTEVFPQLEGAVITHCWSQEADVSALLMPVLHTEPGLRSAGGYSGCGTVNAFGAGRWAVESLFGVDSTQHEGWNLLVDRRVLRFPAHGKLRRLAGRTGAVVLSAWSRV